MMACSREAYISDEIKTGKSFLFFFYFLFNFSLYLLLRLYFSFQLFAISYHQCRWNYNDQDDVKKYVFLYMYRYIKLQEIQTILRIKCHVNFLYFKFLKNHRTYFNYTYYKNRLYVKVRSKTASI